MCLLSGDERPGGYQHLINGISSPEKLTAMPLASNGRNTIVAVTTKELQQAACSECIPSTGGDLAIPIPVVDCGCTRLALLGCAVLCAHLMCW